MNELLDKELEGLDVSILVNAAGKAHMNPFHKHSQEMTHFMLALNVHAMVAMSHYFVPKFLARREARPQVRAAMINYSSAAGYSQNEAYGNAPWAGLSLYSATKTFNRSFSNSLQVDY